MNGLLGLKPAPGNGLGIAPYGVRHDGSGAKGKGYFGLLQTPQGHQATEYSVGTNINGKPMEIPSIVPGLSGDQLKTILGGGMSDDIFNQAMQHAIMRMKAGLSPFAGNTELRYTPGLLSGMER